MPEASDVRLDKWLWAVRLYKTRTQAAEAIRAGHVKISGGRVKPSRMVKVGEEIEIQQEAILRRVKVVAVLENRVGAKKVPQHMTDLTPPEEYARVEEERRAESARLALAGPKPDKRAREQLRRMQRRNRDG